MMKTSKKADQQMRLPRLIDELNSCIRITNDDKLRAEALKTHNWKSYVKFVKEKSWVNKGLANKKKKGEIHENVQESASDLQTRWKNWSTLSWPEFCDFEKKAKQKEADRRKNIRRDNKTVVRASRQVANAKKTASHRQKTVSGNKGKKSDSHTQDNDFQGDSRASSTHNFDSNNSQAEGNENVGEDDLDDTLDQTFGSENEEDEHENEDDLRAADRRENGSRGRSRSSRRSSLSRSRSGSLSRSGSDSRSRSSSRTRSRSRSREKDQVRTVEISNAEGQPKQAEISDEPEDQGQKPKLQIDTASTNVMDGKGKVRMAQTARVYTSRPNSNRSNRSVSSYSSVSSYNSRGSSRSTSSYSESRGPVPMTARSAPVGGFEGFTTPRKFQTLMSPNPKGGLSERKFVTLNTHTFSFDMEALGPQFAKKHVSGQTPGEIQTRLQGFKSRLELAESDAISPNVGTYGRFGLQPAVRSYRKRQPKRVATPGKWSETITLPSRPFARGSKNYLKSEKQHLRHIDQLHAYKRGWDDKFKTYEVAVTKLKHGLELRRAKAAEKTPFTTERPPEGRYLRKRATNTAPASLYGDSAEFGGPADSLSESRPRDVKDKGPIGLVPSAPVAKPVKSLYQRALGHDGRNVWLKISEVRRQKLGPIFNNRIADNGGRLSKGQFRKLLAKAVQQHFQRLNNLHKKNSSSNPFTHESYLFRRQGWQRTKLYCVIKDSHLYCYQSEEEKLAFQQPVHTFPLSLPSATPYISDSTSNFCFNLLCDGEAPTSKNEDDLLLFEAETQASFDTWLGSFKHLVLQRVKNTKTTNQFHADEEEDKSSFDTNFLDRLWSAVNSKAPAALEQTDFFNFMALLLDENKVYQCHFACVLYDLDNDGELHTNDLFAGFKKGLEKLFPQDFEKMSSILLQSGGSDIVTRDNLAKITKKAEVLDLSNLILSAFYYPYLEKDKNDMPARAAKRAAEKDGSSQGPQVSGDRSYATKQTGVSASGGQAIMT
eukprot:CAMPEP_0175132308 /NCGR_PEP_ID=MMETSP0087-20121206/7006_1 /TAXON_ID=136419 /ORGANISM="Unknown Unknown, Strain D1" /LENGTH=995 /DNA_ID=CAMNT_0016414655 /DNA_START=6 /DNA_END=2993 /DNA_ORIENTATION=-